MASPPSSKRPKLTSPGDNDDINVAHPSLFERLPKELFWQIIEFAPNTVFLLRSTSHSIQTQVDEFALQPSTILLVKSLKFTGSTIEMAVDENCTNLFELRLNRLLREFCGDNPLTKGQNYYFETVYRMVSDSPDPEDDMLELLRCIGRRVSEMRIANSNTFSLTCISKIIENVQISELDIEDSNLSDTTADFISEVARENYVKQLYMRVFKVSVSDPVNFMLNLSSFITGLYLYQGHVYDIDQARSYLFGVFDADWSTIILKMFSKKLETIHIQNNNHPEYLSLNDTNALINELPKGEKKILFRASCNKYPDGVYQTKDEYSIRADNDNSEYPYLQINHDSRQIDL